MGGISVVIPAHNVEPFVGTAIESVLAQEPPPAEVIVVDDGSTDGTADILKAFGKRIRVLTQDNHGLAAARNAGAAESAGSWIFFLDADDVVESGAFSRFNEAAERHRECGVITSNFWWVDGDGGATLARTNAPKEQALGRSDLPGVLRRNWLLMNCLVRRDVWQSNKFREDYTKDWDFWIRVLLDGTDILVLGRPEVRVARRRVGSLTSQLLLMRANRRRTFTSVWDRRDLTTKERMLALYQLFRTSVGEACAAAAGPATGETNASRVTEDLRTSSNLVVRATGKALLIPGVLPLARALDKGDNPA